MLKFFQKHVLLTTEWTECDGYIHIRGVVLCFFCLLVDLFDHQDRHVWKIQILVKIFVSVLKKMCR